MATNNKNSNDILNSGSEMPEALYEKYAPQFLSVCFRYCGNIEDAEDALQDGFIRIMENLSKYRKINGGSFVGWMKRIIINTVLNYIRDHAKEKRFLDVDILSENIPDSWEEESNFEELAEKICPDEVVKMISELPIGYRTVFNMYVFESYSHRKIAKELGCSTNTSKSQLSKARRILRKRLTQVYSEEIVQNGKREQKIG
jgi:RNA polymerase sigma-70 factor (ECF subfamily)